MKDLNTSNEQEFKEFILKKDHPCIMAQAVFRLENYRLKSYPKFGAKETAKMILTDLETYISAYDFTTNDFYSFVAVFDDNESYTEIEFENILWKQLQHIHDLDSTDWDKTVSNNPKDNTFSFSIGGTAFFVIGMHANSSRIARQSPKPSLIFNLHWQFEKLREQGVYNRIRDTIRQRDLQKNGSINPMLNNFGNKSEAMQYSGREVDDSWKCPFKHHKK